MLQTGFFLIISGVSPVFLLGLTQCCPDWNVHWHPVTKQLSRPRHLDTDTSFVPQMFSPLGKMSTYRVKWDKTGGDVNRNIVSWCHMSWLGGCLKPHDVIFLVVEERLQCCNTADLVTPSPSRPPEQLTPPSLSSQTLICLLRYQIDQSITFKLMTQILILRR